MHDFDENAVVAIDRSHIEEGLFSSWIAVLDSGAAKRRRSSVYFSSLILSLYSLLGERVITFTEQSV